MAMANCLPAHINSWSGLYDLKGSADDKIMVEDGERVPEMHKRCWNASWMLCEATGCNKGVPLSRQRYLSGKRKAFQVPIYLTKEQKDEVMFAVRRDVSLFTNFHLMDYSMIVGVYHPSPGRAAEELEKSQNILHGKAYASQHGGNTTIVYFGIIDFLQAWTVGSVVHTLLNLALHHLLSPPSLRHSMPDNLNSFLPGSALPRLPFVCCPP